VGLELVGMGGTMRKKGLKICQMQNLYFINTGPIFTLTMFLIGHSPKLESRQPLLSSLGFLLKLIKLDLESFSFGSV